MLKLNVGLTKKVGEPNFGSKGASVNVELELDSGLLNEPERLRERIKHLFGIARDSVDAELNGASAEASRAGVNGNGHTDGNGQRRDKSRKATVSQARALHTIADRQRVDLAGLLRQRFGVDQAGDLSITEASQLIDELKSQANGHGGRR